MNHEIGVSADLHRIHASNDTADDHRDSTTGVDLDSSSMGQVPDRPQAEAAVAATGQAQPTGLPAASSPGGEDDLTAAWLEIEERQQAVRAAEELARVGSWSWNLASDRIRWSPSIHKILGTNPDGPAPTLDFYETLVHPDDRERYLSVIWEATRTGEPYELDHRIRRSDGEVRHIRASGRSERDSDGQPVRLMGSLQDLTEMMTAAQELQRSRDLFAGVLNAATEQSIIATDADGLITVFNTGAEQMLGYSAQEMIGTSPERLHDPAEIHARAAELGVEPGFGVFLLRPARGKPETRQWTYLTRDGQRLLASLTVSAMRGACGEVTGFIKVGTDITERAQAQAALQESESRFRNLFQYAPNGMLLLGIGRNNLGRFLQVNPALSRLTGYSEDQLLTMGMGDLVAPDDREAFQQRMLQFHHHPVLDGPAERHWIHADGHDLWVQINVSPGDAGTDGAYVIGQVDDITARKEAEETLRHQALHDGLTGLPNRVLLMDRIEHALAVSARSDRHVGVLYLDLDGFKGVNDTAGHAAGDLTLIHIARQLRTVLRPGDTVARLGGDEFVMVCENLDSAQVATAIADRVLAAIRAPFTVAGHPIALGGSIGISLSDHHSNPDQLLQQADQAMYVVKGTGKGRARVGGIANRDQLAESAQAARAMRLTAELAHALERDELIMFGQPVVDLRTGAVVAVETLLRWQHPIRGLLTPADFLDVAESGDLMLAVGRRVIRESCRIAATWSDVTGQDPPAVHVNVSGRQLESGNLHQEVQRALAEYQLDPGQLILELTETHTPLIADSLKADLQGLRKRGVKVAIDDLGTGYSSLTRITELPVDILKIDLSFVAKMETEPACAAVVRGVLAIGEALGLDVIAEGVETVSQAQLLMDYGCATAQGYLYSRPLPEHTLHDHLNKSLHRASI